MHRHVVMQDMGIALGRLPGVLEHVQRNLAVTPLWTCPLLVTSDAGCVVNRPLTRGPLQAGTAGFPLMLVDVGVYGEPAVSGFRHRRDVRALQLQADVASFYGMSYLSPEELDARCDFAEYEALRAETGAAGALPHFREKVVYFKQGTADEAPHPLWRLQRAGLYSIFLAVVSATSTAALAVAGFYLAKPVAAALGLKH